MNTLTVIQLKKICRAKGIKNYSKLNKNNLINTIQTHTSVIRLQRWIRGILSKGDLCSISLEKIKYPCFAHVPKENVIIYYNLGALKDYLITTGNFRDPNTRDYYTETQLKTMDVIEEYTRKNKKRKVDSVYKASKNTKFYKKIKERENEIEILEREMDDAIEGALTEVIYDTTRNDRRFILGTVFFMKYQLNFRRLIHRDREHAEHAIKKNIDGLTHLYEKIQEQYDEQQREDHMYMINWIYQLDFNFLDSG